MKRAILTALLSMVGAVASAQEWTVAERLTLAPSGAPVDLASYARADEDPIRIAVVGSYSFLMDGSELDALGATRSDGTRDESAPFVILPPGATVISSEPALHRYVIELPRGASLPVALNVIGLSMRHLVTASEVRGSLQGSIVIEHLVPPPPPPAASEVAVDAVTDTATSIPVYVYLLGTLALFVAMIALLVFSRRRGERVAVLLRRAERAHGSIATEVIALGPAYDPVVASARRLLEAATQHATHYRSVSLAIGRTEWAASDAAREGRQNLERRRAEVLAKLEALVGRLEGTATVLAGRAADAERAHGVEAILDELRIDLDAAVEAEDEVFASPP